MRESKRVCIYPKDVMCITGKSERYSRRLLARIKTALNKTATQYITIDEFASHTGISETLIKACLND